MNQPCKVAKPARDQLNREHKYYISMSPLAPALEFGLARRVRPSRPASACGLDFDTSLCESSINSNDGKPSPGRVLLCFYCQSDSFVDLTIIKC